MKRQTKFFAIYLILVLVALTHTPALAGPPTLPSSFYGIVKKNGANVPAGTVVSAWIGGIQCAQNTVSLFNGDTVYSLDIPADNTDTSVKDGGVSGDVVVFRVGSQTMIQTGAWHSGANVRMDLTLFKTFFPMVARSAGN